MKLEIKVIGSEIQDSQSSSISRSQPWPSDNVIPFYSVRDPKNVAAPNIQIINSSISSGLQFSKFDDEFIFREVDTQPTFKSRIDSYFGEFFKSFQISPTSSDADVIDAARFNDLKINFENSLIKAVKEYPFEPGISGPADKIIEDALAQYAGFAMTWVSGLFLDYFSRPAIAADLLSLVSRVDYQVAKPSGVHMALSGINHKNAAVQEAAIRAFENWADPSCLSILENVQPQQGWVGRYLREVIRDIQLKRETAC